MCGNAPLTAQKERSFYHSAFSANRTNCQAACFFLLAPSRSCLHWGASARLWPISPKPSSCSRRPVSTGTEGPCCSSPRSHHLKSFTFVCAGFWPWLLTLCSLCPRARTTWRRWRTSSSPWSWRKISPLPCFTRAWPSSTGACSRYVATRPQPVARFTLTYCPYVHWAKCILAVRYSRIKVIWFNFRFCQTINFF